MGVPTAGLPALEGLAGARSTANYGLFGAPCQLWRYFSVRCAAPWTNRTPPPGLGSHPQEEVKDEHRALRRRPRMSQMVVHGNTVYLAGQVARNAGGRSVTEQTRRPAAHRRAAGRGRQQQVQAAHRDDLARRHRDLPRDERGLGHLGVAATRRAAPASRASLLRPSARSRSSGGRQRTGGHRPGRGRRVPCPSASLGLSPPDPIAAGEGAPKSPAADRRRRLEGLPLRPACPVSDPQATTGSKRWHTSTGRSRGRSSRPATATGAVPASSTRARRRAMAGRRSDADRPRATGDVRLDGLHWVSLLAWPGAIHEGEGEVWRSSRSARTSASATRS